VKVEGGAEVAETVAPIINAGVPVIGHIRLPPQVMLRDISVIRVSTEGDKKAVIRDAKAI
jgi:3-methyl-2-oxobutanoate hydroxymethyltransferase